MSNKALLPYVLLQEREIKEFKQRYSVKDIISAANNKQVIPFILAMNTRVGADWARNAGLNNRSYFVSLHDPHQLQGTINPIVLLHDSFWQIGRTYQRWHEMIAERLAIVYEVSDDI